MRVIFMRHGQRAGDGDDDPLTAHGCNQATQAGAWLRERGYHPTHLLTTPTLRARKTGELAIADAAPACVVLRPRSGMPRDVEGWDRLARDLEAQAGREATALVVGHHPTQGFVQRTWAKDRPTPKDNRCAAFVLEGSPGVGWRCTDVFEGVPPALPRDA
jgi:phosphohistidine phosphatase SixA